ncbi:MAG: hypothetical protein E7069_12585 [Bacteroidales bacterium]|jgi:hypothetical protein|nr:hypothetical protein [Bacteroidales bacterium]
MITIEKLGIYKKYQGDGDAFCRVGKKEEKNTINYSDWKSIDEFLQDIFIVKKGFASKPFEIKLTEKLNNSCENQKVIDVLWNMT